MTASEPFDLPRRDCDGAEPPDGDPPITVRGLDELRASIPYLLGFYPEKSLVVIALRRDGSVLLTLRIDAPRSVEQAIEAIDEIALVLHRGAPDRVVVAYCDDYEPSAGGADERARIERSALRCYQTVRDLAPVLARELAAHRISAAFVWPERPGLPRAAGGVVPQIALAQVLSGKRLLRNRGEVGARLEPGGGAARRRVRAHLCELRAVPHSSMELFASIVDLLERQATSLEAGIAPAAPEPYDAAICVVALQDVRVRDLVITVLAQEPSWCQDELWCQITRLAPTDSLAPIATMAAIAAYLSGDGALARCAFDLALRHDPDYSLAQMIDGALRAGIHPNQLRSILASTFDPEPIDDLETLERLYDLDDLDEPDVLGEPDDARD